MGDDAEPVALVIGAARASARPWSSAYRTQGTTVVTWDMAGEPDVTCDVRDPGAVDGPSTRPGGAGVSRAG